MKPLSDNLMKSFLHYQGGEGSLCLTCVNVGQSQAGYAYHCLSRVEVTQKELEDIQAGVKKVNGIVPETVHKCPGKFPIEAGGNVCTECDSYMPKDVELFCIAEKSTALALLCDFGDAKVWIPRSQIDEDSEVLETGHKGVMIIPRWLANEKGLI